MRILGFAVGAVAILAAHAAAADARFEKSLQSLAPDERLEQLCDYTAMTRIRQDSRQAVRNYRPDRAVANAIADVKVKNYTIEAKGGAFRSRGKWYALTYTCTANAEHLKVESFTYTIGNEIPEAKWASYGLWQ